LIIGPGVSNDAPGLGGSAKGVGKMSEFVSNTIGLEIGDVVTSKINAPFLEISANNFGMVLLIVILFACSEWKGHKEREQQARKQDGKHAS
jgi:hypothetical protein